jgi:uncharacterized protein YndB with AHSA1/START domain
MAKASKPKRPTRDEFELEEMGNQLVEAKDEDNEVVLSVWGEIEPVQGRITELDARKRLVHVERHGETVKIPFLDIMKVGSPNY